MSQFLNILRVIIPLVLACTDVNLVCVCVCAFVYKTMSMCVYMCVQDEHECIHSSDDCKVWPRISC